MKRAVITVAAVLVLVGATEGWANLVPVNSNSVIQDGIEYYIETDKVVYDLGEDVEMIHKITNLRDEEFEVTGLWPIWNMIVTGEEEGDAREIWWWHWYRGGPGGPVVLELDPGVSAQIEGAWAQIDYKGTGDVEDDVQVAPGLYTISGVLRGTEDFSTLLDVGIAVDITVIPEPATIVLLCGGVGLLGSKRKRL